MCFQAPMVLFISYKRAENRTKASMLSVGKQRYPGLFVVHRKDRGEMSYNLLIDFTLGHQYLRELLLRKLRNFYI